MRLKISKDFDGFWLRRSIGQMRLIQAHLWRFPHCMDARQISCRTVLDLPASSLPVVSGKHSRCVGFCLWAICAKPMEEAKSCSISKVKSPRSIGQSVVCGWYCCWYWLMATRNPGSHQLYRLVVDPCLSHYIYIHGFLIFIHPGVTCGCFSPHFWTINSSKIVATSSFRVPFSLDSWFVGFSFAVHFFAQTFRKEGDSS